MKLVIYFLCSLFSLTIFSQKNNDYRGYDKFIHFDKEDGLSQNAVIAIQKDSYGFMWIGTKDGLNKFDGERFSVFKKREEDSTSLNDNHIMCLEEDDHGVVWIGTRKGINRYDPTIKKVKRLNALQIGDSNPKNIRAVCKMQDQTIWFSSYRNLFVFDKEVNRLNKLELQGLEKELLEQIQFYSIYQDSIGTIWIGTNKGLYKITKKQENNVVLTKILEKSNHLLSTPIRDIVEDSAGNLWLGTENMGLWVYHQETGHLQKTINAITANLDIRELAFDANQNLWIACFKGLYILKKNGTVINPPNQNENGGIISDGLKSVYVDEKGSVWLGGYFGGFRIWNKYYNDFKVISTLHPYAKTDLGLVNTIAEDESGNIYLGTKKNGIIVLNKNKKINYRLTTKLTKEFLDITIKAFWIEKNLLWISTLKNGIFAYDLIKEQFLSDPVSEELQNALKQTKAYTIAISDQVLVGGTVGDGMYVYNFLTKKTTHIPFDRKLENKPNAVLGNVKVLYFDKQKNLWIGSITGLKKISSTHIENKKFLIDEYDIVKDPKEKDINTISENSEGELVIGSSGNVIVYKNSIFKKIDFSDIGIGISKVSSCIYDDMGILWVATDKGIIKYNNDTKTADLFDQNKRFVTSEFRDHSSLCSKNGSIFIGTSTGVLYFNPENIVYEKPNSRVLLTAINIEGSKKPDVLDFLESQGNFNVDTPITLSHDQNSFTIQFSSLNYTKVLKNPYEYRLLGLSNHWKTTSNPEVIYTLQKSGNYVFQVRKVKLSGIGVNEITSLPIKLKAAPWKSSYAFLSYILLVLLIFYGVYSVLRSKTELKHQLALENLEKRKEKEKYTSQIEFFTNLSHDFRTPLTLILTPLNQLIENYNGSSTVYNNLLGIRRNADQLLTLINQLLDFRKIEADKTKLEITKNDIVQSLNNVFLSFEDFAKVSDYIYTFNKYTDSVYMYYDAFMLERVFYNLISNAFKNTPRKGKISVSIAEQENIVIIRVIDNGIGIDQEIIDSIFERFYKAIDQSTHQETFSKSTGIGLHIAKKTIDLHQGNIIVESSKNKGSIFSVTLKKGTAHLPHHLISKKEIYPTPLEQKFQSIDISINEKEIESIFTDADQAVNKPTILIVEDNNELRKQFSNILKNHFSIEQATNGAEGFSKSIQKKIDLIISDVMMPKLNGLEFCQKIKADERTNHIPVILLTSRSSETHKLEGLESGADFYLTKPIAIKEFLLIVRNLLSTHLVSKEKYNEQGENMDTSKLVIDSEDERLYKAAMKIIKDNISNSSFEVNEFSSQLGINRSKLFKKIKEWTGQTPKEFIQFVRLKMASQLLEERADLNISTICYEVGFASPHYFARCFKKQFKQTPSAYAHKFRKNKRTL